MSEICSGCVGACCRQGMRVELNRAEADFISEGGGGLRSIVPVPLDQPEIRGVFVLTTDCGYLQKKDGWLQCSAHENPNRPRACLEFAAGSVACNNARLPRGIAPIPIAVIPVEVAA